MNETTQLLRAILEKTEIITAKQDAMDTRLGRVESRLDTVDTRLDQMDSRFDQMEARLDQMDSKFDQMDMRLIRFEENANKNFLEMGQKLNYIAGKVIEHDMQLAILNQQQS